MGLRKCNDPARQLSGERGSRVRGGGRLVAGLVAHKGLDLRVVGSGDYAVAVVVVLGTRLGYYVLEYVEVEGSVGWTHVVRPAEIVESLFNLALEEEDFHMLFYAMNVNVKVLPGRQMVPFLTFGAGSTIMQGQTETSINYGVGTNFFVRQEWAVRFEFRNYAFDSGSSNTRRDNMNFEFSVGASYFF